MSLLVSCAGRSHPWCWIDWRRRILLCLLVSMKGRCLRELTLLMLLPSSLQVDIPRETLSQYLHRSCPRQTRCQVVIFVQIGLGKARLRIVVGKGRICELRALASSNPRVYRPSLATPFALQAQCCWDSGDIDGLSGQVHQDPEGERKARSGVGDVAGVVCNQCAEPAGVGGFEVVI